MPKAWSFSELAVLSLSFSYLVFATESMTEQPPRADIRTSYSRLSARLSLVRSVFTAISMSISKAVHPTAEPGSSPSPSPSPSTGISSSRQYSRARRDDKMKRESNHGVSSDMLNPWCAQTIPHQAWPIHAACFRSCFILHACRSGKWEE